MEENDENIIYEGRYKIMKDGIMDKFGKNIEKLLNLPKEFRYAIGSHLYESVLFNKYVQMDEVRVENGLTGNLIDILYLDLSGEYIELMDSEIVEIIEKGRKKTQV